MRRWLSLFVVFAPFVPALVSVAAACCGGGGGE